MTVPPTFRRTAKVPKILVLHRGVLDQKEVEQRQGFAVTRPLRTIMDVAATDSVSRDFITQALRDARRSGLITVREISEARCSGGHADWFAEMLAENEK